MAVYLLVGVAYVAGTFVSLLILLGPALVYEHLAYVAAKALHTTLIFTLCLAAVDIALNRVGPQKLGYSQRTAGRQWLVMLAAFVLAFTLFRTYYIPLLDIYAPWVVDHYQEFPEDRLDLAVEFFYYVLGWLITAGLVIQFALRSQRLASEAKQTESAGNPEHPAHQTQSGCFVHASANQNLKIPFSQISHVSVEDHYCRLTYKNGGKLASHVLRMPLNQLEKELPKEQFARIHRSHLVNLRHVMGWRMVRQQRRLVMEHGVQLPISRHRMAELKPILKRLKLPRLN
ncbi:MAG: LytTR family transcriptional regulator [Desulfobacterales bacterium]|nr:LytTR family transcriptional regulator [Desulfobacterales bacterium]